MDDSISQVFRPNFGNYTINPPLMPLSNYIARQLKKSSFVVKPSLQQGILPYEPLISLYSMPTVLPLPGKLVNVMMHEPTKASNA